MLLLSKHQRHALKSNRHAFFDYLLISCNIDIFLDVLLAGWTLPGMIVRFSEINETQKKCIYVCFISNISG